MDILVQRYYRDAYWNTTFYSILILDVFLSVVFPFALTVYENFLFGCLLCLVFF